MNTNDDEFWNEVYKELEHINDNLDEWGDGCPDPPVLQELQDTAKRYLDMLRAGWQKFIWLMVRRSTRGAACVEYSIVEGERICAYICQPGKARIFNTKYPVGTKPEVIDIVMESLAVPSDIINDATNNPTNYSAMKIADKKGVM